MDKRTDIGFGKPIVLRSSDPRIWAQVSQAKKAFIETGTIPDDSLSIPEEIIVMWQRSLDFSIQWDAPLNIPYLSKIDFAITNERKRIFIDVASQFVELFQELVEGTDFVMSIMDEKGTLLSLTSNSSHVWADLRVGLGGVWSEEHVGCCAHTLVQTYKRPVQIIGSANFLQLLENNLSSAAPIFNEYGDMVGTILLVQRNADNTQISSHGLGWVTSIATAITNQLKLFRRDARLQLMNSTLQAAFAHASDGYLAIDETGYIVHSNDQALTWLRIPADNRKTNLLSLLLDPTPVSQALKNSCPAFQQQLLLNNDRDTCFIADIEPFYNDSKTHAQGAVIKLKPQADCHELPSAQNGPAITFDRIIGQSKSIQTLKETAKIVSQRPINVLLLGESGTGKEVFAQAIHNYSTRSAPFVAINCAAIPANLIESELFGYEGGAFTGAERSGRMGKIEHANGGTLFLDEIGDMPIELQAVLLRVLEEKKVTRIGGHKSIPVNFRLICATNKPLFNNQGDTRFRKDLYYRLAVANLELPSLKERGEDIVLLAEYFIKQTCSNFNMHQCTLAEDAKAILLNYSWPGNVRQLQNAMIYAVTISPDGKITEATLPKEIMSPANSGKHFQFEELKNLEKDMIQATIDKLGSATKAAKHLGISRATLYRKINGK